jgi:hypothetical protein
MNTGVEILLKRMETHPDDFDYNLAKNMSRWYRLYDHAIADELVTEEEEKALKDMLFKLRREKFTEMVMRELAGVEDEPSEVGKSLTSSIGMAGATQGTWGNTNAVYLEAQKIQMEQMRLHLDAHRDALKTVEVNKKPLIKRIFK